MENKFPKNVRQIGNVSDTPKIYVEDYVDTFLNQICEKTEEIPEERFDCEAIEKGEERFASWEWKYGRKIPFEHEISKRFGWGGIDLQFHVDKGVVQSVNAYSDGMEYSLVELLPGAWQGKRYEVEELSKALDLLPEVSETEHQMKQDISALLQENL